MRSIGIIPARYGSSRFPGKPLVDIKGKTMIQRVYEQAINSEAFQAVVVATDDQRIFETVEGFGGQVVMTDAAHQSGTDRCFEALQKVSGEFDVVVNIQGDEPFVSKAQIELILSCFEDESTEIGTLVKVIEDANDLNNPNKPKVLVGSNQNAIYFSRQAVPYLRDVEQVDWVNKHVFYKHIGMYAYHAEVLAKITQLAPSKLEQAEGLEQLRWIENGFKIKVAVTQEETAAVDTPEDLENILKRNF